MPAVSGRQATACTSWPTEAADVPCCTRCNMLCSRFLSVGLAPAAPALALLLTPRSVISLLNVVFRLATLALAAALELPADALVGLLLRVSSSDSSLRKPPWP